MTKTSILSIAVWGLALMLLSSTAMARSIVCDPYPTTGTQPEKFGYIEGTAAPIFSPAEVTPAGKRCNINIDAVTPGNHTYQIFARNDTLGVESTKVTFTFQIPAPLAPPANIRCEPICAVVP